MNLTIEQIADFTRASIHNLSNKLSISRVSTDTRDLQEGDLFLALSGDRFNGHDFIGQALNQGASAIVLDQEGNYDFPYLLVADTKKALFDLAQGYRMTLPSQVIGITGSNGKTTTKDILASLLAQKYKVYKTPENQNNEIGLSKTILATPSDTDYLILEMGIENFKEMTLLTKIARPDIGILTNIGDSHLSTMKTKENVARAKLEILEGIPNDGLFIYNYDDPSIQAVLAEFHLPINTLSYGVDQEASYTIDPIKYDETGATFTFNGHMFTIPLLGEHQMYNGAIAILVAQLAGLEYGEIARGLSEIEMTSMRSELIDLGDIYILNDAYKSNPQSLHSILKTVYNLKGFDTKIAVIGDMLELGENEVAIHESIGQQLNPELVQYIVAVGTLSYHIYEQARARYPEKSVFHFANKEDALPTIESLAAGKTLIMIKASRALALEDLAYQLTIDKKEGRF